MTALVWEDAKKLKNCKTFVLKIMTLLSIAPRKLLILFYLNASPRNRSKVNGLFRKDRALWLEIDVKLIIKCDFKSNKLSNFQRVSKRKLITGSIAEAFIVH